MNDYEKLSYKSNKQKRQLGILIKKITYYKQELQRKDNIINELKQNKRDYERENILEMKLHILDNNWNELKEFIKKEIDNNLDGIKSFSGYQCKIILDKIKELESK